MIQQLPLRQKLKFISILNGSVAYRNWGISTDVPTPADYDGDGKADISIYRKGVWYIQQSSNASMRIENFGLRENMPVSSVLVQ